MKKLPRPDVTTHPYSSATDDRTVVRLEWDFFAIEMFDDEAMVMARSIYDVLEEPPAWAPTHRSLADGSLARIVDSSPTRIWLENEDGVEFCDQLSKWELIPRG
jgi:hypothetical protein